MKMFSLRKKRLSRENNFIRKEIMYVTQANVDETPG